MIDGFSVSGCVRHDGRQRDLWPGCRPRRSVLASWMLVVPSSWLIAAEKDEAAATRLLGRSARVGRRTRWRGVVSGRADWIWRRSTLRSSLRRSDCGPTSSMGSRISRLRFPEHPSLGRSSRIDWSCWGRSNDGESPRVPCEPGRDFNVLAAGGSAQATAPLVFVGYGITAPDWQYDDYAGTRRAWKGGGHVA